MSIADILSVLYGSVLRNAVGEYSYDEKDKFILSKGHAALCLYAALGEVSALSEEQLKTFQKDGSDLIAHPVMNLPLGIESSNGSLGQGISMAVGLALAAKRKGKLYKTYVLIGNGESDEGIVWEALAAAVHFKLDNLTVILDDNKLQNDGFSENVLSMGNYAERFRAFGLETIEIDGHNITEILSAFEAKGVEGKPRMIVANTVKGKGISFMENNNAWHHNRVTNTVYTKAMEELNTFE